MILIIKIHKQDILSYSSELLDCLNNNISLSQIDKIIVFTDDFSFDPKRHTPPNHKELSAEIKRLNDEIQAIHQVLFQRQRQGIDETKEADYGDEYQDMVKRVGQKAKEGPRKTVWDPEKRVYKTVPVNEPKKVNELSPHTLQNYARANVDDRIQRASSDSFVSGKRGDMYNKGAKKVLRLKPLLTGAASQHIA